MIEMGKMFFNDFKRAIKSQKKGLKSVESSVTYHRGLLTLAKYHIEAMGLQIFFHLKCTHTIRKCKKMAGQNTFQILLLNDANTIGEH